MMASVSSAAGDSRRGRSANCARSIVSAYSRRVEELPALGDLYQLDAMLCAPYVATNLGQQRGMALSGHVGIERARSSSSVSGRDAANSAASSSFARGCAPDHHRDRSVPDCDSVSELRLASSSRAMNVDSTSTSVACGPTASLQPNVSCSATQTR